VKFPVSTATGSVPDATSYLAQVSAMVAAASAAMGGSETAQAAAEAAQALAQAAQAAAEAARDEAEAITGFPESYQTPTPVITGTTEGDEVTTASGGISNFNADADYTWTIPAAITTWSFNSGTGAWSFTLPLVTTDTPLTLSVTATRAGELRSVAGTKTVTSLNVPIQDGPTMTFNDDPSGFPDGDFA
jgi:type II secretory pathway pseudopilin PulG